MKYIRFTLLGLIVLAMVIALFVPEIRSHFSLENMQGYIVQAGSWGYLLYLFLFIAGVVLNLPALIFVGLAPLAFGKTAGFVLSLAGATLAVSVVFYLGRVTGGDVGQGVKNQWVNKWLARLQAQPFQATFLLRLAMFISPPITLALALARVPFRHFLPGTILGILPLTLVINLFLEQFMNYFAG